MMSNSEQNSMITELTAEQQTMLDETLHQWLDIGRSTKPLDREAARSCVEKFYAEIGRDKPQVMFFSSPLMCIMAYGVMKGQLWDQLRGQLWDQLRDQLRDQLSGRLGGQLWYQLGGQLWYQLRDQLWDQLRDQLWDQLDEQLSGQLRDQLRGQLDGRLGGRLGGQLRYQLGGQLWYQLRDQLWDQLRDQLSGRLGGQLWDQLGGQLWDQLRDQLWDQLDGQLSGQLRDQLGGRLRDQLDNCFAGAQWCAWEVFYDFCRRIGVTYTDEQNRLLDLWLEQPRTCHWWFPYDGVVLMSERPTITKIDTEGRLHSEDSLAIGYSDGWGVYAWHGTRVPEHVIMNPETITPESIEAEGNAEVRRVMMERYGFSNYFAKSGGDLISEKTVWGQPVKLYRKDMDGVDMGYVHVINGTVESDGSRHEFIIPCKIINDDAEESVYGTYPELIDDIKRHYPTRVMDVLRQSIRT